MRSRVVWLFVLLLVGVGAAVVYFRVRVPPGTTPMNDQDPTLAWVALATSIVSMATAVVGLIREVVKKD